MEIYSIYRIVLEISHLFSFYLHTICCGEYKEFPKPSLKAALCNNSVALVAGSICELSSPTRRVTSETSQALNAGFATLSRR